MAQEIKSINDLLKTKRGDSFYAAFATDRNENYYFRYSPEKEELEDGSTFNHMTVDPLMVIVYTGKLVDNIYQLATSLGVNTSNDPLFLLKSIMKATTGNDSPNTDTSVLSFINFITVIGIEYEYYAEVFRYIYHYPPCANFMKDKASQTYINSEATIRLRQSYIHGSDNYFYGNASWVPLGLESDIKENAYSPTAYYDIVYLDQYQVNGERVVCHSIGLTMRELFRYVWKQSLNVIQFDLDKFNEVNSGKKGQELKKAILTSLREMDGFFTVSNLVSKAKRPVLTLSKIIDILEKNGNNYDVLIDRRIPRGEENLLLDDMLIKLLRGYFINTHSPMLDLILRLYDCIHTANLNAEKQFTYIQNEPSSKDIKTLVALVRTLSPFFQGGVSFVPIEAGSIANVKPETLIPSSNAGSVLEWVPTSTTSTTHEQPQLIERSVGEFFKFLPTNTGESSTAGGSGEAKNQRVDTIDGLVGSDDGNYEGSDDESDESDDESDDYGNDDYGNDDDESDD